MASPSRVIWKRYAGRSPPGVITSASLPVRDPNIPGGFLDPTVTDPHGPGLPRSSIIPNIASISSRFNAADVNSPLFRELLQLDTIIKQGGSIGGGHPASSFDLNATLAGAGSGALLGGAVGGPYGLIIGGVAGAALGAAPGLFGGGGSQPATIGPGIGALMASPGGQSMLASLIGVGAGAVGLGPSSTGTYGAPTATGAPVSAGLLSTLLATGTQFIR